MTNLRPKYLRGYLVIAMLMCGLTSTAQNWIDTTYTIASEIDQTYKVASNFAGRSDTLTLDVSYPTDAPVQTCGRPLLVAIHGGAWIAGTKEDWSVVRMREEFAKRGYVTASINYRKGLFNTNQAINCNVPDWNCYNATDTSEWYRANYRGMLDARSAIEYMVDNYDVDPTQVFVVGESAGGFIAMSTGFVDDESEIELDMIAAMDDAPAPNAIYQSPCIQKYGMAESIAAMNLSRDQLEIPDFANQGFQIKGVGNIYGGAFNNIFETHMGESPALYLYHQPCDQIVYHRYGRLLNGFVNCLTGFPTYCGYIVNRDYAYGSTGIATLIDTLVANDIAAPDYVYDNTGATYNCAQQATSPSLVCHALDNYWLRTSNMAEVFAEKIEVCKDVGVAGRDIANWHVQPNPTTGILTIKGVEWSKASLYAINGQLVYESNSLNKIDISSLPEGMYWLQVNASEQNKNFKIIKR